MFFFVLVVQVRFIGNPYYFNENAADTNVAVIILASNPLQKSITIG
jgi:hypothetical protein